MKKTLFLSFLCSLWSFSLYAQSTGAAPPRDQGLWQTVTMILIALLFFYFILWRPEQKRRKALDDQRSHLKQGDRVTAMGIIGTVVRVEEQTVIVKMYDGAKVEFLKGAITDVASGTEESKDKD